MPSSWIADRTRRTVPALAVSAAVAALGAAVLALGTTPAVLVLGLAVLALGQAPVFPLADAATVVLLGENRRDYGRIRAVGSVAFVAVVLGTGQLAGTWPAAPRVALAALLGATALATLTLPDVPPGRNPPSFAQLGRLARSGGLGTLVAVTTLHGTTLALYDRLFALHADRLGVPDAWTAVAIGAGVAVEVAVLWWGRAVLHRVGPGRALVLAAGLGVVRWAATALAPVPIVLAAQLLHGATYGLFWVAGVALFSERAPPALASSAQTLLTMGMFGVGPLLAMGAAAALLPRVGTTGLFLGAAAVAAIATALAWGVEPRGVDPGHVTAA